MSAASTRSSRSIAPGVESAQRTPGRAGEPTPAEHGYLHCGPPGAGHFVKMVHNGIEYGLMAAYAEGLNILQRANVGCEITSSTRRPRRCAIPSTTTTRSTSPSRGGLAARHGRRLLAHRPDRGRARGSPALADFSGRVSDSGEGRWTVLAAVDEGVPAM